MSRNFVFINLPISGTAQQKMLLCAYVIITWALVVI